MRLLLTSALASAMALPAIAADKELTVFDWAGFEEPSIFQAYIDKNGDSPTYAFYGDDDEAFQKMASGFKADVVHPCSQMVSKYRDAGLIEPWDTSKITNFDKIEERFLDSEVFKDDEGVWYIPTDWGATAIAYNTETVPEEDVSTLQVFVDPKYQGRTSLPDSSDDVWALAYLATGTADWTDVTDEQFQAAAAWSWNDGVVYLQNDNYPVGFQRSPKEGSSTFFCGYVNVKNGPGSEDKLYDYINAWLEPSSGKALLDTIGYGHTSSEAMATIADEPAVKSGLSELDVPVLSQTPNDPAQREKRLAEFEKIKAGF